MIRLYLLRWIEQCCLLPIGGPRNTDHCISHSRTLTVLSYRLRLTNTLSGRVNELMACISYNTSLHFCHEVSFTSFLLFVALHDLGLLIVYVSRWHSDTPHSVWLPWTSDRPIAEISTWQHPILTSYRYPWPRCDSNQQSHQARGRRPTP